MENPFHVCGLLQKTSEALQQLKLIDVCCLQRAHVQQFIATEDALNAAADAKKESQELVRRIHGASNAGDATNNREYVQNSASSRQFEVKNFLNQLQILLC